MRFNKQYVVGFLSFFILPFFIFSCKGKEDGVAPSLIESLIPAISPASVSLAVHNLQTFTVSGGLPPYTYSVVSGSGSILSTTGAYTAPAVSGTATVRVTDSLGVFSEATVTINEALQISPTSKSLGLSGTQTFTTTGGVTPVTFSIASGLGSVNASSGLYTAPVSPGSAVVKATDAAGNTSTATVSIFSSLGISPTSIELAVNNSTTFSAAGGSSPYTFSVLSGSGIINASSGIFTASSSAGSVTIRVTDSLGSTADSLVTVNAALAISPSSQNTLVSSTISFSATGGVNPYTYSLVSGVGAIDANSGLYTAPASNGSAIIRVTDNFGNYVNATVNVTSVLNISPTSKTLAVNNTQTFIASGGTSPYTYSVQSGTGSINSSSGLYTAPASAGSAVVLVTDSLGATVTANVTVNSALAISPSTQAMSINGTLSFSSTGGVVPYTYSIVSGGGTVDSSTGAFTAPASAGTTVVRVTDSNSNTANSTVTVTAGLGISPAAVTLAVNNTRTFSATGGSAPFTYSIVSGGGTVNSSTGLYTAPASAGSAVVRVTDSLSATSDSTVTINAALAISPTSKTLAVNNSFTFSATGGVSPYTYSIVSGGGTINSSSGLYTAPASAGAVTLRVTDNLGNVSNSTVTINAALSLNSAGSISTISASDTLSFSGTGGVSPYMYSIFSGPGSINSSTGLYTAVSAGSVTVRVTDSLSNTSDFSLTVNGPLAVSPASAYLVVDSDLSLTPSGGVAPYSFSIVSGAGTIDSAAGVYTAASTTGSATLRTTDAMGNTANTTVTIYNALTLSPLTVTMAINTTQSFTAAGGVGALSYSVYSGTGSVDGSGLYTAPATAGSVIVRVQDTIGNVVDANVTIVSSITITPQTLNLPVFSTAAYSAVLGTPAYTYSVVSGTGSVVAGTGIYTAASTAGAGSIRVTDSALNTSTASVTHITPSEIVSGSYHTCVRYNNGGVKCFGLGSSGQLGSGSTANIGSTSTQVGGAIPFVNLGTGRTATALAAGINHTCAILDNSTLKCWGSNTYGQLGAGNTTAYGSAAGQMGDSLPAVNLGVGRSPTKVFAFGYVTCVILDNSQTKCFGRNSYGQLGQDDIVSRGTSAAQMGDSLLAINLGSGRTATKMTGGLDFTCALLDNATVKCFGRSNNGQTGYQQTGNKGDVAGSMSGLVAVNLGTGRTVTDLTSGYSHSCALLDNSTMKCWGRNQSGQLGLGNTSTMGAATSTMGDSLSAVPLTSFTPVKMWLGRQWTCAANASSNVRCWGLNSTGQLLVGSTSSLGDGSGEVAALANINFGTSVTLSSMSNGYYMGCGIMTNNRIKCFGSAVNNALLNASTITHLGDAAGELGDSLPYINH